MISVLVVEDSAVIRDFLVHLLQAEPGMQVVGTARDGHEAVEAASRCRPDVITMDIHMPRLDGLEATRRIMATRPVPIVIVSGSTDPHEQGISFDAMQAGAIAVMRRPAGPGHPEHEATVRELLRTVRLMAEVKVVRRWPRRAARPEPRPVRIHASPRVVAIGASTGGPPVIQTILAGLPGDFPLPLLIVQHIAAGFASGFVDWLSHSSKLSVGLAAHGQPARPGHVYIAPDDRHLELRGDGTLALTRDAAENGLRPAVSALFRSVGEACGANALAGLLSGMGRDGAEELRALKERGAVTFVQDEESAVVYGMPGEAMRLDAASLVLTPAKIVSTLVSLAAQRAVNEGAL